MTDTDLPAGLHNGAWLDLQEFPPLEYAVPDVIPEGVTLLAGAPKVGKSWLVLDSLIAVASGGVALGKIKIDQPRPALYLALEDGDRRLQARCRKLLGREPIPALLDYLTRVEVGRVLDTIAEWLKVYGPRRPLVVLDTLGKVMPPAQQGETTYGRDYRVGNALHALCDRHTGMSLLVNHHDRKAASDDFVDMVSGTNGLAGAADSVLMLCRDRHETAGLLKVTGRDVREAEYALEFRDGYRWQLDGDDLAAAARQAQKVRATTRATTAVGERMIDVVLYAYAHPEGVRRGDVAKALEVEPDTAGVYLSRAVELGRLQRAARGLYTPIGVTSVTSNGQPPTEHNERNTDSRGWRAVSAHALCDHCATAKKLTTAGTIIRHYLTINVSRRAVRTVGRGRVKRLCPGSGRPPRGRLAPKVER
jgi:AAA domain